MTVGAKRTGPRYHVQILNTGGEWVPVGYGNLTAEQALKLAREKMRSWNDIRIQVDNLTTILNELAETVGEGE